MNRYFVQFIDDLHFFSDPNIKVHAFRNGFSSTYGTLKDMGDFVWVRTADQEIPELDGEVYMSVYFDNSVRMAVEYAKKHPNVKIHMGGPYFAHYDFYRDDIPNLRGYGRTTVEEMFGFEFKESDWDLVLPDGYDDKDILYTYPRQVGYGCRWGRCTFCKQNFAAATKNYMIRDLDDIPVVSHPKDKHIWVHNSSPVYDDIVGTLKVLENRNDVYIGSYIRGDAKIYRGLKDGFAQTNFPLDHMNYSIGVEIPSDRMLRYVQKGTNRKWLAKCIKLMSDAGCRMYFNVMLGFGNLTWNDVDEIIGFWKELQDYGVDFSKHVISLLRLVVLHDRPMMQNPPGELVQIKRWQTFKDLPRDNKDDVCHPRIYHAVLEGEQFDMNQKVYEFYKSMNAGVFIDYYDVSKYYNYNPLDNPATRTVNDGRHSK
jgi:hypothetical protein